MNVLSLSDEVLDKIYSANLRERFPEVDMVISCGDLPYYYLEFVIDALIAVPLFFVRGNHAQTAEFGEKGKERKGPMGAVDLHRKVVRHEGLLMAGFEGSVRYREGKFMYTQNGMWLEVLSLVPRLVLNRLIYGRALDVLVTHAPPWGIHDQEDLAHHGFKAFRWLLEAFRPAYHFHGHIHVYSKQEVMETDFGGTRVINTYGYRQTVIAPGRK
jgi:Icc-related predicted phosphoesterase